MAVLRAVLLLFCAIALAPSAARAERLAELLAMPTAASLTGARDVPRFAWVESRAGVRNIWVADRGAPARAITRLDRDDGEDIYDLALSPDGGRIAYVRGGDGEWPDDAAPNAAGALIPVGRQLFVQSTDGGPAQRIGEGNGPAFSPDGRRIVFANGREIWVWDGAARKIATVAGSVGRLAWSPDGARLLFLDDRRDHGFLGVLDLASSRLRYIDTGPDYAAEPVFSPDGKQIAFIRYVDPPADAPVDGGPYWSLRIADAATGATRTLWSAPKGMGGAFYGTRSKNLFWSADGQIVFPWERSGWIHPYAIDAARGGTPRDLTPGDFEVETYLLDRTGRTLIYAANAGDIDRRHIWSRPLSGGPAIQLTRGTGIESYPTPGGNVLAVLASDARTPARAMLIDEPKLAPLDANSADIFAATRDFVTPEQVVFKAEDGVTVHAQLFRGRGAGKRPALVFIHGGPRRQMLLGFIPSGYYSNTYILNQHFAAQGYTVLSVNYRSGTGYGQAFRDAPEIARAGASEYRDILAAGKWLAAQNDVDAARIGVWGGSWGGYLTALALARDSDLFAAGVDLHGVHTLLRPVPDNLSPDQQLAARRLQWESSPMGAIERWRSPVLLVHGDDDRNVPFSQTVLLARELAARGIPHRAIAFPNERHSFLRYESWLTAFRAADSFFDRTIKQRAPLE